MQLQCGKIGMHTRQVCVADQRRKASVRCLADFNSSALEHSNDALVNHVYSDAHGKAVVHWGVNCFDALT